MYVEGAGRKTDSLTQVQILDETVSICERHESIASPPAMGK